MLKLNGITLPSFVKVNKVNFSVLPPIENKTVSIRGKKGLHYYGQQYGGRIISADITIIADKVGNVMPLTRELAAWLYHTEPVPLIVEDEPDLFYKVLPDGETDISEVVSIGQGTISFLCTEPFAYGPDQTLNFSPTTDEPHYFEVGGTAETYPQIELTMKKAVETFTVIAENGQVVGGNVADAEKAVTNKKPRRLWDEMTDPTTWTSALAVDEGIIAGSFTSNGYSFYQTNNDYGTNANGWHGAAGVKTLAAPIQDFEVDARIIFKHVKASEVGRIEVYLLDANNEQIGKIHFRDTDPHGLAFWFESRAGNKANGTSFVNKYIKGGTWADFDGAIRIGRKGKEWYSFIGKYDDKTKKWHSRLTGTWVDSKGSHSGKLAKVQIHIAKYKEVTPVRYMYITDIKVYEHVELTAVQTPLIAEVGDVFLLDNEASVIYKNGEEFYEGINPATQFFSLKKGLNGISVIPEGVANVAVTYKERWL